MSQFRPSSYLALARDLSATLAPVQPRPAFRDQLGRSLAAAAQQQRAHQLLGLEAPPLRVQIAGHEHWRRHAPAERWVIGVAAVGSAASLIGIIAYLVHRRGRSSSAA